MPDFYQMIVFSAFKKQYAGNLVLDIPAMDIPTGTYWLKGINGSGKSTLLKSLAGLIPFEGFIIINGTDISKYKRLHRQLVNFAAAAPLFPTFLTGMELINFFVETKKGNKAECLQFCNELQLSAEALGKKTGAYSSGMIKKLSLVLAFAGPAQWILLDEPLITLDAEATSVILQRIEKQAAAGTGMLLTSHQDMDFPNHGMELITLETANKTIAGL